MNEKTANIENFIGIYNNYITEEDCNKAIKLFDDQNKFNKTMNRQYFEKVKISDKQDQQYFANTDNITVWYSETEFLNFSKRVKPKRGRIVIWPAGFPYVHRGNPPLSGEKYLLTSWMLVR